MALMWLGSLVLMVYGLRESQRNLSRALGPFQRGIFEKSLDSDFSKMLPRALTLIFLEASPLRTQQTGLALHNLRILGKRPSVLLMGLCNLGAWWVLILGLLYMNVSGMMLLGVCAISLFSFMHFVKLNQIMRVIFGTGLFLLGAELMLRNSSILQTALGESDFAFFLADGRWPAVFGIFALSVVLSLFIEIEFWSLCLALNLLLSSTLSFNGAIALLAGERCARGLLLWWSGKNLNQDCQKISRELGLSSAGGAFVGLIVTLYFKNFAGFGASFGMEGSQERSFQLIVCLVLLLLCQFIGQMTIGHFTAQGPVEEVQQVRYFPLHWITKGQLSVPAMSWGHAKVSQRIHEIRYHLQGLGSYKPGQIPEHLQQRLKSEEEELVRLQPYLEE